MNSTVRSARVTEAIARTGFGVTAFQIFFFAGVAIAAALVFGLFATRYRLADYYRKL